MLPKQHGRAVLEELAVLLTWRACALRCTDEVKRQIKRARETTKALVFYLLVAMT